jgi:hypothetical protein
MILQQYRDHFLTKYKIECLKRGIKEIDLVNQGKVIAMLVYDAINDIQSRLGSIENLVSIALTSTNYSYALPMDFGYEKSVMYSNCALCKRTASWIHEHNNNCTGMPNAYAIVEMNTVEVVTDDYTQILTDDNGNSYCTGGIGANILVSPSPNATGNLSIYYEINIDLFNPNTNDDIYSGALVFPSLYDHAVLNYMIDSMFYTDVKPNYEKEMSKLRVKEYNGEKIRYHWN